MKKELSKKKFLLALAVAFLLIAVLPSRVFAAGGVKFELNAGKNVITNTTAKIYTNLTKKNGMKVNGAGIYVWEQGSAVPTKSTYYEDFKKYSYYSSRTSLPIQYQVGCFQEVNMGLASGKTYNYRVFCLVDGVRYWTSYGTFRMPSTISFTLDSGKNAVSTASARVYTTLKKKSGQKVYNAGIYVWKKGESMPSRVTYTESYAKQNRYEKNTSLPIQYWIGKGREVNYPLIQGQTYNYRVYCWIDGIQYWTPTGSFTVKKPADTAKLRTKTLPVKTYNQTLDKYKKIYLVPGYKDTSIYSIGCLTCAYATLQSYHEATILPENLAKKMSYTKDNLPSATSNRGNMKPNYITNKYKSICTSASKVNFTQIYNYINQGKPVLAGIVKNSNTGGAPYHWVVISGYKDVKLDSNGNPTGLTAANFLVADSGYKYGGKNHSLNDYYSKNASRIKVMRVRK